MRTEFNNFHELFQNPTDSAFIRRLDLDKQCANELDMAVGKVKACLTPMLRTIAEKNGVDAAYRSPKYRLQGSKVYGTQNAPAHVPDQQVDVDLGVYLAASFMDTMAQKDGVAMKVPAKHVAKLYFDTVDHALRQLCVKEGWKYLDGDSKKETCCRIDLSPKGVDAHIDVPLYAMPNQEYEKLAKSLKDEQGQWIFESASRNDLGDGIDEDGWEQLDVVVMATRKGEWSESDVQKVIVHFKEASSKIGHPIMLRRLWRYVKAWRDFKWRIGNAPSSILLMEGIVRILQEDPVRTEALFESRRDDRLILHVFQRITPYLEGDVIVNWGSTPEPLNRGDAEARQAWVVAATHCAQVLERCLYDESLNVQQVVNLVIQNFGKRIPNDVSLVKGVRRPAAASLGLGVPLRQESPQVRIRSTQGA